MSTFASALKEEISRIYRTGGSRATHLVQRSRHHDRRFERIDKADVEVSGEGGTPVLDESYPPSGEPLYWEEFKAWASANIPEYSLAVIDEHVADPITAAALQSYRAGRTATRFGYPAGTQGLADFRAWASTNLHIKSKDPRAKEIAERGYFAGSLKQP